MNNAEYVALAKQVLYGNYRPAPVAFVSGHGCTLVDADGKRYLDFAAGVAVCAVGHAHPDLTRVIAEQAARLIHVSNYFYNGPNVELAAELAKKSGMAQAFFCNSGAEANEALLKLARRHFFAQGQPERRRIIAFHNAFHGRTMGALTMTGTPKYREGFGEAGPVTHVSYGSLDEVRAAMGPDVAAIIVECVQGEGGVLPSPAGFLEGLRAICDQQGSLLLIDEVQTGIGRLGRWFGYQGKVMPDAIALAKGLGGGVPIGAMLTNEKVAAALPPGTHGSTFGGNPLACAASLEVLRIIERDKLCEAAKVRGAYLSEKLRAIAESLPNVCEGVRGEGLLQGLVLKPGMVARDILGKLLDSGVLLTAAGERVLRFTPPLIVTDDEIDRVTDVVRAVLAGVGSQ